LQADLFDPVDKLHLRRKWLGRPWHCVPGFAGTIAIGSPLLDFIGMGRLLPCLQYAILPERAWSFLRRKCRERFPVSPGLRGNVNYRDWQGLVETVINPLTASLYTDDKTRRLNALHAWWPGGIIIGGLLGLAMSHSHVNWRIQMSIVLLPAAVFGMMALTRKFPPTERVALAFPHKDVKEAFRPLFILWFLCMFLTAASELPRAMGGHGVDPNRRHEGHLASDLCQRSDVHYAPFCRSAGS